jgi:hypothetical protein
LFNDTPIVPVADVAHVLTENHYLGAAKRGFAWSDEFGVLVFANPELTQPAARPLAGADPLVSERHAERREPAVGGRLALALREPP